ncbi:MAG: ATP:cob(I)alamin adenosyltransferase [Prevotella sp.]|nr:ATP:cob(I)alamin adenosyltransferase [Prevotella sp.]
MKVTTKTGDRGTTSLYDGTHVSKDDIRIELNGQLDHLNALLGLCKATHGEVEPFETMQKELMTVMSFVAQRDGATADQTKRGKTHDQQMELFLSAVTRMEDFIREATSDGDFDFVLPGKNLADAALHLARTQVRTCERRWVALMRLQTESHVWDAPTAELGVKIGIYLNRMSDYLFCLSLRQ